MKRILKNKFVILVFILLNVYINVFFLLNFFGGWKRSERQLLTYGSFLLTLGVVFILKGIFYLSKNIHTLSDFKYRIHGIDVIILILGIGLSIVGILFLTDIITYNAFKKDMKQYTPTNKSCPDHAVVNIPSALNQGNLSTSTACAVSNCIRYNIKFQPSRLFLQYHAKLYDNTYTDGNVRRMCESILIYGFCDEKAWPYDETKLAEKPSDTAYFNANTYTTINYVVVPKTLQALRELLSSNTLVLCDINKSVISWNQPDLSRTIIIYGYDDNSKTFNIQVSWETAITKINYDVILSKNTSNFLFINNSIPNV
jgi:hypothetical protein